MMAVAPQVDAPFWRTTFSNASSNDQIIAPFTRTSTLDR
jgi:hypothetical protein